MTKGSRSCCSSF